MGVRIGTAGWSIPRGVADAFASEGSQLQRYSGVLESVEINTTFKHTHRPDTYVGWASSVGEDFRFAVKFPQAITHQGGLGDDERVRTFLEQVGGLGRKLGPLLLQFPPRLAFEPEVMEPFWRRIEASGAYQIVCEPRHPSWFTPEVDRWLADRRIARVAADPSPHPKGGVPGGWRGLSYYRLHGAPRMYFSAYPSEVLEALLAEIMRDEAGAVWCIFDNTASGAAANDALRLKARWAVVRDDPANSPPSGVQPG